MKRKDYSYAGLTPLLVEVRVSVLLKVKAYTHVFASGRPRKSHHTTGVLGYVSSLY